MILFSAESVYSFVFIRSGLSSPLLSMIRFLFYSLLFVTALGNIDTVIVTVNLDSQIR